MKPKGVFVGLSTVDLIYGVPAFPSANSKQFAQQFELVGGGPALNASVAFSRLGGEVLLVSQVGAHPLASLIKEDLVRQNVRLVDLSPGDETPPIVAAAIISGETGDRCVVAAKTERRGKVPERLFTALLDGIDVVLVDGHLLEPSIHAAKAARVSQIPVVMDGGKWKEGWEALLPLVDYAVCSSDFHPPGVTGKGDTLRYLEDVGVQYCAITDGSRPIWSQGQGQNGEIPVHQIHCVDSLGAGDIFHGAFCYFICKSRGDFQRALSEASKVAAAACGSFGTRAWSAET